MKIRYIAPRHALGLPSLYTRGFVIQGPLINFKHHVSLCFVQWSRVMGGRLLLLLLLLLALPRSLAVTLYQGSASARGRNYLSYWGTYDSSNVRATSCPVWRQYLPELADR